MKLLLALMLTAFSLFAQDAFISSETLTQKLHNKNLVLIDTTDAKTFASGHIPDAIQVDISAFRHWVDKTYLLMNSSKKIEQVARKLGINKNSYVVIYGHNKDKELLKASYIALALIVNGFNNISILNGGYGDWLYEHEEDKGMISTQKKHVNMGNFTAKYIPNVVVGIDYVRAHVNKIPMIEARPKPYYTGEKKSKGVRRLGHITGATSSNWRDKFNVDDTLKSDKKLNKIFIQEQKLDPSKETLAYCTGGLEASMNWYILTQYMHFKDVKIYDASMKQWGNLDDTPMQTK